MAASSNNDMELAKKIGLWGAPAAALVLLMMQDAGGLSAEAWKVLSLAVLMLGWWLTEVVPLPVTALLPMALLPMLGVGDMKTAAAPYANPIVYLFFGGFMIALAMEKWQLHRRIALGIVRLTGTNANGIILGFMLASAFISMWISNTATTLMMLPIALSVIALLVHRGSHAGSRGGRNFSLSLMLGISYASSIGGIATLVGTPPNVVFKGILKESYGVEVSFADWMFVALPFSAILLLLAYFLMVKVLFPNGLGRFQGAQELLGEELEKLGAPGKGERRVLGVFVATALLWIFGALINKANPWFQVSDEMVALLGAISLFLVPAGDGGHLLNWQDTERLPWGILLLFGGGLSLADALARTGVIQLVGQQFAGLEQAEMVFILGLAAISILLTEVMSNLALVTIFLPVVGGIAQAAGLDVTHLAIPVTIAASCAFMLPMSTPPNAIVFASGHVTIPQMARAGIWLNLIAIVLIWILSETLLPLVF